MQMRPFFGKAERTALSEYNFEDGFLTEFKETKKFALNVLRSVVGRLLLPLPLFVISLLTHHLKPLFSAIHLGATMFHI